MKTKWFVDVNSIDELKKRYKELCFQHHPDRGGDTVTMQSINIEYHYLLKDWKSRVNSNADEVNQEMEIEEELMAKIQEIIGLDGIEIEVCGLWIWLSGNTYPYRKILKGKEFLFAIHKKMWFWRPMYAKCYFKRKECLDMEEIRDKYGSIPIDRQNTRFRTYISNN